MSADIITFLLADKRTGKSYSLRDGVLEKGKAAATAKGHAHGVRVHDAGSLVDLLEQATSDPSAVLIPGHFVGNDEEPFDIVFEAELARLLGREKSDPALAGVHTVNSRRVAARLKRSIEPCLWVLLDFDVPEGMPPELALDIAGRLALLERIVPGISICERVEARSSSARIVEPGGKPGLATHAWIRVSNPELVETLRLHIHVEAALHGLSFFSPRYSTETDEIVGQSRLTVLDLAVLVPGRIVFCSAPTVDRAMTKAGWTVVDAGVAVVNRGGGALDISRLAVPTRERLKTYRAKTGEHLEVSGHGASFSVVSRGELKLDTAIETDHAPGVKTFGDAVKWARSQPKGAHLRCQTPFRPSASEAAFVKLDKQDEPFLHDVGTKTTYRLADEPPPHTEEQSSAQGSSKAGESAGGARNDAEPLSPEGSEDAIALDVVRDHHHDLRYIAEQKRWLRWDGTRWVVDRTFAIWNEIRPYVRAAARELDGAKDARKLASAAIISGVERVARSDFRVAATVDQFDADPFDLNTPGGIIDLRTGHISPCHPLKLCTKSTAVGPRPGKPSRWLQFLDEITGSDQELGGFLQRMAGYMLTGDTSEHALFFGHGTGANGKSVLVNVLRGMMGSYATAAPAETFLASKNDRHPTELADLFGARLVVASEIDTGRRWNEARIKELTGGDPVKARYMRQDFFEYTPQFKLLIVGNHRPSLRGVDEAMRRRMNLLPFTVTIAKPDRDPALAVTLRAEWPQILQWAIEGGLAWQISGLRPPACVRAATDDYLAGEDAFSLWLDERTEPDLTQPIPVAMLFASWKAWCEANGEQVGSQKRFSQTLRDRHYKPVRMTGGTRGFEGLHLKQ